MPLRRLTPLTFRAKGVTDSIDGTNAMPGSMLSLANLVHAPSTMDLFVPRPAATEITGFTGFTSPATVSLLAVIGTRAYGMIASSRYANHDEPFCYDLLTNTFIALGNVTAANTPVTQSIAGDWIPPTLSDVTNGRIIFTHPGFPGTGGIFFGWLDISSFSLTSLKGNTTNGSPVIRSILDASTSAPIIDGVQPGMAASGAGIPAGTYVVSATNGTFSLSTTGNTHTNTTLDSLASIVGLEVGMSVSGPQFAAGTYIAALPGGSVVTLSAAALGSVAGTAVVFSGGGTITLSQNATATATLVSLTIAGGTPAAPLWGAGNTNTNPLATVPRAVAQFNGRAWYAVGDSVVFSDTLNPTQVTNATQALILDGTPPVTALAGQPLTSQITGGIIQALIAFKGADSFYQITGDAATSNLAVSVVAGSVGTQAPNTLAETPLGLAFIAPDGLRILSPAGTLTDPVGSNGKGISVPFLNANYPSRMCMAYGQNSLRVSVQNSQIEGQPWQEWVLNFETKTWSGPHSFPSTMISYYANSTTVGFISVPQGVTRSLWFHTLVPQNSSVYVENGNPLSCLWETTLLPDNEQMMMNRLLKTTLAMILPPQASVTVTARDESSATLDTVIITNPSTTAAPTWGSSTWGAFNWGAVVGYFKQWRVPWTQPVIFKQATISVAFPAAGTFAIGNMNLGYQILGYSLEDLYTGVVAETDLAIDGLGGLLLINTGGDLLIAIPAS